MTPDEKTAPNEAAVKASNTLLENQTDDHLYHFGISRSAVDLPALFGDVRFVCTGGSASRFAAYAERFAKETGFELSPNLSKSDRFVIYKTGPVMWINHGMGTPSLSVMLVELFKLLFYAGCTSSVVLIRLGTSGGIGVPAGTVVISSGAMNGELTQTYVQYIGGRRVERECPLDPKVRDELLASAASLGLHSTAGITLCTDDFYEGQMRLDGFFCEHSLDEKAAFLERIHSLGVRNIEMESTCLSAMAARANIRAAICCVTLLNRMHGDQVLLSTEQYHEFEQRPYLVVSDYIRRQLGLLKSSAQQ